MPNYNFQVGVEAMYDCYVVKLKWDALYANGELLGPGLRKKTMWDKL